MTKRKMPAPQRESGTLHNTAPNGYSHYIPLPGHDRVEPLDAEDRADLAALEAALARGYRLATWCTVCGRPLTSRKSLLAHVGPVCRNKAVAE